MAAPVFWADVGARRDEMFKVVQWSKDLFDN